MAENDIYNSKLKYEHFKATCKKILKEPTGEKKNLKDYCRNPDNLRNFYTITNILFFFKMAILDKN